MCELVSHEMSGGENTYQTFKIKIPVKTRNMQQIAKTDVICSKQLLFCLKKCLKISQSTLYLGIRRSKNDEIFHPSACLQAQHGHQIFYLSIQFRWDNMTKS